MFEAYAVQWIYQLSCSIPYTLLNAILNHTDLLSSHITLLTHSKLVLTVIPKCFLENLYFCRSQPAFLQLLFYPNMEYYICTHKVLFLAAS